MDYLNMKREAIILAGGLGTRLRDTVGDLPKSMAPVAGHPFLSYILEYLSKTSFSKVVLATGYKHQTIMAWYGDNYKGMNLEYSVEDEPLGTGGALLKASSLISSGYFFVFNGDTFFNTGIEDFEKFFIESKCDMAVALKPMKDFERYGSVNMEGERIVAFNEKKYCQEGLINGGLYIINPDWFKKNSPGEKFSFEKDIMEIRVTTDRIYGYISDSYFIDIGIPEDYERAGRELPSIMNF
jgi:D-glycero-alpha-D-manno-heptose 1-phosphate guanylyltransferase